MVKIETDRSMSGNTKFFDVIFNNQNAHIKSKAAYSLLRDKLKVLDESYVKTQDNLSKWLIFREEYLLEVQNENSGNLTCSYCGLDHLEIGGRSKEDMQKNNKNPKLATVDHITAMSKGGEKFDKENMLVSCKKCNKSKSNKTLENFLLSLPDNKIEKINAKVLALIPENVREELYKRSILSKNNICRKDVRERKHDYEWLKFRHNYLNKKKKFNGGILTCAYCGKTHLDIGEPGNSFESKVANRINRNLATIDHITAKSNGGGKYNEKNMLVSCAPCNVRKRSKDLGEFVLTLRDIQIVKTSKFVIDMLEPDIKYQILERIKKISKETKQKMEHKEAAEAFA